MRGRPHSGSALPKMFAAASGPRLDARVLGCSVNPPESC